MIALESDRMRLEVEPAFGARVTSLVDRRTGRDWLVPGPCAGDPSDAAAYRGAEARGWDECWPTVSPCEHPAWGPLRDHGALWGRPWAVEADARSVHATWRGGAALVERTLTLDGPTLTADYRVEPGDDRPWMWSQHLLLATRAGERIRLDGVGDVEAGARPFAWPSREGRDLSVVGRLSDGFALKAYAAARGPVRAAVEGPGGGIALAWDGDAMPALGLWMDWGGWPPEGPVHQLALEPTTAAADDLRGAEARGQARRGPASWRIALSLTDPPA